MTREMSRYKDSSHPLPEHVETNNSDLVMQVNASIEQGMKMSAPVIPERARKLATSKQIKQLKRELTDWKQANLINSQTVSMLAERAIKAEQRAERAEAKLLIYEDAGRPQFIAEQAEIRARLERAEAERDKALRFEKLEAEERIRLRAMLERLEWIETREFNNEDYMTCPTCHAFQVQGKGHQPECELAALLGRGKP